MHALSLSLFYLPFLKCGVLSDYVFETQKDFERKSWFLLMLFRSGIGFSAFAYML